MVGYSQTSIVNKFQSSGEVLCISIALQTSPFTDLSEIVVLILCIDVMYIHIICIEDAFYVCKLSEIKLIVIVINKLINEINFTPIINFILLKCIKII